MMKGIGDNKGQVKTLSRVLCDRALMPADARGAANTDDIINTTDATQMTSSSHVGVVRSISHLNNTYLFKYPIIKHTIFAVKKPINSRVRPTITTKNLNLD